VELEVKVLNFGLIQCLRATRTIRRIQGVRMCGNMDQMCVLIKECMNIVFISRTNHISFRAEDDTGQRHLIVPSHSSSIKYLRVLRYNLETLVLKLETS
jgi:hypothetical protein